MKHDKMLFVFNPIAGKSEIPYNIYEIINEFTKHGYLITVYPTQAEHDGYKVIKKIGEDFDTIVCAGGDGTLNETVSAMMELNKKPKLGYIPSGTVNDFAKSVGIPLDYFHAVKAILEGDLFSFDVGSFNDKYFSYVAGFGAFTNVSYGTPQRMKNIFGDAAYILEGAKQVANIDSYRCEVNYDGNFVQGDYILGLVSSATSIGGMKGLTGAFAEMDDGLFELNLIKSPSNLLQTQEIISMLLARELKGNLVHSVMAKNIVIKCNEVLNWTIDGEFGGSYDEVTIINNHKALKVFRDLSPLQIRD